MSRFKKALMCTFIQVLIFSVIIGIIGLSMYYHAEITYGVLLIIILLVGMFMLNYYNDFDEDY